MLFPDMEITLYSAIFIPVAVWITSIFLQSDDFQVKNEVPDWMSSPFCRNSSSVPTKQSLVAGLGWHHLPTNSQEADEVSFFEQESNEMDTMSNKRNLFI